MKEILPKRVGLNDVEIWFQDEARVEQKGTKLGFGRLREHAQELFVKNNMNMPTFLEQFAQQEI